MSSVPEKKSMIYTRGNLKLQKVSVKTATAILESILDQALGEPVLIPPGGSHKAWPPRYHPSGVIQLPPRRSLSLGSSVQPLVEWQELSTHKRPQSQGFPPGQFRGVTYREDIFPLGLRGDFGVNQSTLARRLLRESSFGILIKSPERNQGREGETCLWVEAACCFLQLRMH